jgi:enterochelin esterase-like enzyme
MSMRNRDNWPRGKLERLGHRSQLLRDNPLGDPWERELPVYLPAGYNSMSEPLPVFWHLAAYTNSGASMGNWRNVGENLVQRLDRLIGSGAMGPVIVVAPDCFTSLGGNQYVNSPAIGAYADHIHQELIPFVDQQFNTIGGPEGRAVFGKSSGGYGALMFGLCYSQYWGALANHSGDAQFDVVFRGDFAPAAETLKRFAGSPQQFVDYFWAADNPKGSDFHTLMLLCLAASYDPDPDAEMGICLPFDLETLELDPQRWQKWLEHDPIHCLETGAEALKKMRGVYMDCGYRDQYRIQYGSRILDREMTRLEIDHHYEEFDGTHSGIDHRMDRSLPYLYSALTENPDQGQK